MIDLGMNNSILQAQAMASMAQPQQAASQLTQAKADAQGMTPNQLAQVRETAQKFEAMFLSQMMQPMFEGVGEDPVFGGGEGEKMFKSMLVDEYGKITAKSGGVGVTDSIMQSIIDMQAKRES